MKIRLCKTCAKVLVAEGMATPTGGPKGTYCDHHDGRATTAEYEVAE